jgi:integrase
MLGFAICKVACNLLAEYGFSVTQLPTITQAWGQFKEERSASLCPTSLFADYRQVGKWLERCPVQELDQGRLAIAWVLQQQPIKSARRVAMYTKTLYRWASSEDVALLAKNPVANFKMPKPPQEDEDIIVIPRKEAALVLSALEGKPTRGGANWSLYSEFMLQTAMRTGEVRALKWSDIKQGRILVHSNYTLTHGHKNSTKTNRKRWVPLNARCQEILAEVSEKNEYIFPWNRQAFQSYFYDRMTELHSAGLIENRYRPYDLRHTAISRWIEARIPVAQVALWAGNSSEVIWKHYVNVTQEYEMPIL